MPHAAFLRSQLRTFAESNAERVTRAHARLLAATFQTPRAAAPRRRPSLCHDGTPIVYSHELAGSDAPRYRVLVEPGGPGITVAEQIDWSLRTLDGLLTDLGWNGAATDVNQIVAQVFPRLAAQVSSWWGGIWLGLVADPTDLQLRLYLNLRQGTVRDRWQRVADALSPFADEPTELLLQALADATVKASIPVGLGIVIRDGRVAVFRLYTSVHQPTSATITRLLANDGVEARDRVARIWTTLEVANDLRRAGSVTMGYDLCRENDGTIQPSIMRTKVDISFQSQPLAHREKGAAFVASLAHDWGLRRERFDHFSSELVARFGGFDLEYVSFGFARTPLGVTVYAKPHGSHHA